MSFFGRRLRQLNPEASSARLKVYVAYDQLSDGLGPLAEQPPTELSLLLIENPEKAARRPYHRQKLGWILSHQRQFALEQAARGVHIDYRVGPYKEVLQEASRQSPVLMQEAAELELRQELAGLIEAGRLRVLPHQGWLTTPQQFQACKGPPWRMDEFYRRVRRDSGWLMEKGKPVGGKFSFDSHNRQPWKGQPPAPQPPRFSRCELRAEVEGLIEEHFGGHPGQLDLTAMPLTREEIDAYWQWAKDFCLPQFGPFEDAMSSQSTGLFHTRISPLLNLHRLLPRRVVEDCLALPLPLASKEGFLRQILGWREFVRHVHRETEGFREFGPRPAFLKEDYPLPPAFWGRRSGLECLDTVVADVWKEGWSHHITRLMVLSNLATLWGFSPRELSDWFWVAYIDAFDWVVEPNVLGMGTYSCGDVMTTKPYVSGSAYIHKMSDYCRGCRFDPRSNCPITRLYWAFLARHQAKLRENPRMAIVMRALEKRSASDQGRDAQVHRQTLELLQSGEALEPEVLGT